MRPPDAAPRRSAMAGPTRDNAGRPRLTPPSTHPPMKGTSMHETKTATSTPSATQPRAVCPDCRQYITGTVYMFYGRKFCERHMREYFAGFSRQCVEKILRQLADQEPSVCHRCGEVITGPRFSDAIFLVCEQCLRDQYNMIPSQVETEMQCRVIDPPGTRTPRKPELSACTERKQAPTPAARR